MTTYICKCGRRVKKSTDASTTGNRLSGYAPGHECWGCPYAMPYGNYQWDESARTVSRETQGYECRMSKTLTYASEFAGSIKDKCTCRVHSLDFDFLSQVSAWIKDTYPDREIFGSFSKDIRASDYGSDGRYCLTITCTQNLKGVAAKRELLGQFFTPNGSRKDMTPQQEMEKVLTDIKNSRALVKEESSLDVPAPCICSTCTCGGCKEECFGNCRSCGHPVQECNSYQTEGEKHLTPAHSEDVAEPFGNIPAAPTFDFSALGDLSQQATEADQQFDLHYGAAQDEYLISCIYLARIHALTAKAGRYGGGTWTKWYESKGMSKSGAWNMVQTGESFNGSTIDQLKQLPELTRKDLNLIARSGSAAQLVEAAGDSQRVQELLAQLKAKEYKLNETQARLKSACIQEQESRDAMNTANAQLESANADIKGLTEQNDQLKSRLDAAESREEEAWKAREKAEARAQESEKQLAGSRQVAEAANRRADKWKAEAEAARKQPIVAVVDKDEVARQVDALTAEAKAQARSQVEDAQRRANEAEAKYQKLQQDADGFLAPEQACEQQARFIADSMRSMYLNWFGQACATGTPLAQMGAPLYALCGEIISSLEDDTTINPTAAGSVEDAEREALFE
jgi:chemotaxis protein histidine kinase CheA